MEYCFKGASAVTGVDIGSPLGMLIIGKNTVVSLLGGTLAFSFSSMNKIPKQHIKFVFCIAFTF